MLLCNNIWKQAFKIQIKRGLSWVTGTSTAFFFNVTTDDLLTQFDKVKNVKAVLFVDDTSLDTTTKMSGIQILTNKVWSTYCS